MTVMTSENVLETLFLIFGGHLPQIDTINGLSEQHSWLLTSASKW